MLQQARLGDVARIHGVEAKIGEKLGQSVLGRVVIASHEHHRAVLQTGIVRHHVGADVVQRFHDMRATNPALHELAARIGVAQGQGEAIRCATQRVHAIDNDPARKVPE